MLRIVYQKLPKSAHGNFVFAVWDSSFLSVFIEKLISVQVKQIFSDNVKALTMCWPLLFKASGVFLFFFQQTPHYTACLLLSMFLNQRFLFSSVSPSQSFPSDEGWPFAKYLGACGRMVAVNYVGEELWSFYNAPWEKRVDLARQLMDIAEQLTNNDFEFALYLLDVSFDNFAVGPRDGKVIVVDAENVLVADKRLIKQSEW